MRAYSVARPDAQRSLQHFELLHVFIPRSATI
ncbi:no similarity (plasmid) [Sinorhizobium fredii HH103]|uniref:No similarity n=1 Tax=Sinorhizobium fredii (strain HH103) TaxID=1117943 RepID=G9AFH3_SINF1|nr:no similarity [Sinorhizobium fredii HH103]